MVAVIGILGALQLLGGVLVYVVAKSAMHEILAAVLFGSGTISLGVGMLIERLDKLQSALTPVATREASSSPEPRPVRPRSLRDDLI